jgi:hypothetical protein
MPISKRTNWLLSSLGLLSAAFSLVMLFSTTVFASCSATIVCAGGGSVSCNCIGQGVCQGGSKCVTFACSGQPVSEPQCCGGGGED